MNSDEILSEFEIKFNKINDKIINLNLRANQVYDNNCNTINNLFEHKLVETYLNEHRSDLIKQNKSSLEKSLNEFGTFFKALKNKFQDFKEIYSQLELYDAKSKLNKFIKANSFAHLIRFKYENNSDLFKLHNYSKFMNTNKKVDLKVPGDFKLKFITFVINYLNIGPDKILCICNKNDQDYLMIFELKNGTLLHSSKLNDLFDFKRHFLAITQSKIVHLIKISNNVLLNQINIFDFELNLVHTFQLNKIRHFDFSSSISSNEIAFKPIGGAYILIYDLNSFKFTTKKLQDRSNTDLFYVDSKNDELIHLDNERIFFINFSQMVYSIDRLTGSRLSNFVIYRNKKFKIDHQWNKYVFDTKSNYYDYDYDQNVVKIYDNNSVLRHKLPLLGKYQHLECTYYGTLIFNKKETSFDEF